MARIVMVDALHHVEDQQHTLKELWRILKPGGRLVIEEPDIQKFPVKIVALAEKVALMRSHFLTAAQVASIFTDAAARVTIERRGYNYFVIIDRV